MSRFDTHPSRRRVLRTLGAAAVAGTGLAATAGTASAIEIKQRLAREYSDERRLSAALQRHGESLRATLVSEGIVGTEFDFAGLDFDIDPGATSIGPTAEDGRASVTAIHEDGTFTAFGVVSTSSEGHDIALFVQPEREEAYALVEPKSGERRLVVTDAGTTVGANTVTECTSCCQENYRTKKVKDCTIHDEGCVVLETSCECFDCDCGSISTC